jgi:cytochrome P450
MIHVVSSHLDEEIFENPLEFRWDRFQHDTAFQKYGKPVSLSASFHPFGGGHHLCPGQLLAKNEIKIYLLAMLSMFDLKLGDQVPELDIYYKSYIPSWSTQERYQNSVSFQKELI